MRSEQLSLVKLHQLASAEYSRKNYSLDLMREALGKLGNPQDKIPFPIHVTGTNGKGSFAFYLASMLQGHHRKVGLYTSPHMRQVNERIMIGMEPVSDSTLGEAMERVFALKMATPLTYFEVLTCAMFLVFSEAGLDVCVIEVGLGGKLDATNLIAHPKLAVITSIGLDHKEVLGKTEREIAIDKSHIIKKGCICLDGVLDKGISGIFRERCKRVSARYVHLSRSTTRFLDMDLKKWVHRFCYGNKKIFRIAGVSRIQHRNAGLALKAFELIRKGLNISRIRNGVVQKAFLHVFPGRFQRFKTSHGDIVFDGAHNPPAISNFCESLEKTGMKEVVLCVALMVEKEREVIFKLLGRLENSIYALCLYTIDNKRAVSPKELAKTALQYFPECKIRIGNRIKSVLEEDWNGRTLYFVGTLYSYNDLLTQISSEK